MLKGLGQLNYLDDDGWDIDRKMKNLPIADFSLHLQSKTMKQETAIKFILRGKEILKYDLLWRLKWSLGDFFLIFLMV